MTTYMDLTNRLLRKFNEVEITSTSSFMSVRGLQAAAKDAIRDAVSRITQEHYEWPFNAIEGTQVLVPGVSEYNWPENFTYVEWESFYIIKDDVLGTNSRPLKLITREEWYKYASPQDYDTDPDGRGIPNFVFGSASNSFGVTPVPDKAYTVKYRYFAASPVLNAYDDDVVIPAQWDNVIIAMATPDMHQFKANTELAQITREEGMKALSRMRGILINKEFKMYEGRLREGRWSSRGYIDAR